MTKIILLALALLSFCSARALAVFQTDATLANGTQFMQWGMNDDDTVNWMRSDGVYFRAVSLQDALAYGLSQSDAKKFYDRRNPFRTNISQTWAIISSGPTGPCGGHLTMGLQVGACADPNDRAPGAAPAPAASSLFIIGPTAAPAPHPCDGPTPMGLPQGACADPNYRSPAAKSGPFVVGPTAAPSNSFVVGPTAAPSNSFVVGPTAAPSNSFVVGPTAAPSNSFVVGPTAAPSNSFVVGPTAAPATSGPFVVGPTSSGPITQKPAPAAPAIPAGEPKKTPAKLKPGYVVTTASGAKLKFDGWNFDGTANWIRSDGKRLNRVTVAEAKNLGLSVADINRYYKISTAPAFAADTTLATGVIFQFKGKNADGTANWVREDGEPFSNLSRANALAYGMSESAVSKFYDR
jgi:hypothetical protein